jgi:hypothetical protein
MSIGRLAICLTMLGCLAACDGSRHSVVTDGGSDLASALNDLSSNVDATMLACFEPQVSANVNTSGSIVQECAIWNNLSSLMGQVNITRTGSTLTLDFSAGVTFTGTVTGNNVSLTHAQTHTFTDGCLWLATETLTGTLDPTSCAMSVSYAYVESVQTSNGACATPCSASSTVKFSFQPVL